MGSERRKAGKDKKSPRSLKGHVFSERGDFVSSSGLGGRGLPLLLWQFSELDIQVRLVPSGVPISLDVTSEPRHHV